MISSPRLDPPIAVLHRPTPVRALASVLAAALAAGCATAPRPSATATTGDHASAAATHAGGFVENRGQWPTPARFRCVTAGAAVWLERDALAVELVKPRPGGLTGDVLRLRLAGAGTACRPCGEDALPGTRSWLRGNDPSRWCRGARAYRSVRYRDAYPGVDVRLREAAGGLEYDLLLADGDASKIRIRVEGAEACEIDSEGSLLIHARHGTLRQPRPTTWQETEQGRRPVACDYQRLGPNEFGFALRGALPDRPTVIDPGLDWSTYLGGSSYEFAWDVTTGAAGATTVTGETASSDFPTTAGAFDRTYNGFGAPSPDVFVTRFDATGTLVWSTYVGGASGDKPYGVAVDAAGRAIVAGNTASSDYPTTPGVLGTSLRGRSDGFVTCLAADGQSLVYSTYLGGSSTEVAQAVALDAAGRATVAGVTSSSNFPTTPGAYATPAAGTSDVFVCRLDPTASSLVYGSRFGGSSGDVGQGLAVDTDGSAVAVGVTSSSDFPTTPGAYQRAANGNSDAFVVRLDPSGSTAVFATLLGGSSGDVAEAVAIDATGAAVVTGVTSSSDFPTTPGAFSSAASGSSDAFVTRLSPDGSHLQASTLVGGNKGDVAKGIALDSTGAVTVGGQTSSSDFPTTAGAYQPSLLGSADAFVFRLAPDLGNLLLSTYVGGSGSDGGEGLSGNETATAVIGVTGSSDFPTTPGAPGTTLNGSNDAFVTQLDTPGCGYVSLGQPTPACERAIVAGVARCPRAGDPGFATVCTGAPASTAGALAIGATALPAGLPILGITLYTSPVLTLSATTDGDGFARSPLPLNAVSAGGQVVVQYVWLDPPGCQAGSGLSASQALELTIQ